MSDETKQRSPIAVLLKQMLNDGSLTVSSGIAIDVDERSVKFVTRLEHGGSAVATDVEPRRLIVGYVAAAMACQPELGPVQTVELLELYLERFQAVVSDLESEVAKAVIAIKTGGGQPAFGRLN